MPAAIQLSPGVWRVPTAPRDLLNSYLFRNEDDSLALVDTGLKSTPKRILAAIREIGSDPSQVTTILLTHAHADHAGGARQMTDVTGRGTTVHQEDAQYVRDGTGTPLDPSLRLGRLLRRNMGSEPAPVEATLADGDLLPIAGGLRVYHTPGHSPGHISLLHEESRILITGDAIWNVRSRRTWPVLTFCTNVAMTQETANVLADLQYDTAAFTHGPPIFGNARAAISGFLANPRRFPGLW